MNSVVKIRSLVLPILMSMGVVLSGACNAESEQTRLLKQRNAEFNQEIIKVSDRVYTAVGYGVSPVSMIVAPKGLIIVDTGISVESGKAIRADFRKIVDKPVKAIVFTHGHPDHIKGAAAFMDTADVQVWARTDFGHEQHSLAEAGISIQKRRGAMQAGFLLSAEQRINNGIAKAYWPKRKGGVFAVDKSISPTHIFDTDRQTISVAGVDLELVAATGETHDQLYVWFPSDRVAFAGDNFYKSWPNLYAIRGTPYRDIRSWANAIDSVLQEQPNAVVGGHTRPIIGKRKVTETLTNFRDAIRFLFDKTVEGINKGLTPNQLVEYVELPEKYRNLDYLRPYYGNPQWAIRAIFGGYLGWFDGNATSLFPLSDKQEAKRIVAMAGGMKTMVKQVDNAMSKEDYQWAAQLCDHILALDPNHQQAMLYKADALTALADKILTATARNYYISSAIQLRKKSRQFTLSQEP